MKATLDHEIVVRRLNEIGVLADIAKTLAEKGLNVSAVCAWVEGSDGVFRILVDDVRRAADALRAKGLSPRESSVVTVDVPHRPGMLKRMTEKLRDAEIDVHHLYASASERSGDCRVVLSTSDNQRAVVALSQSEGPR